ncbi:ProQ/FINO family protein [Acidithiobacillus thiooxidans]|uniref:Uncharacterized protein n=1 Tax=Acidithiobacillus thiooxidans ATCC 19377 TaxID=637390 RepID=A0A543Q6P0_ACITH|nr:ProQ/FINO family protein [Acidithiobacillus thiooxidans]MDX5933813.1 ProQ/FINO family protein [Acidithiobacillus thiooxidans]TQN51969.1 hypothetical protein DLNHIDIE_01850 [Acidithiobacillus thiooxidans ATCC 19377]
MGKPQKRQKIVYGKKNKPSDQGQQQAPVTPPAPRTVDLLKMDVSSLEAIAASAAERNSRMEAEKNAVMRNSAKTDMKSAKEPENATKNAESHKRWSKKRAQKVKIKDGGPSSQPESISAIALARRMRHNWGHIALILRYRLPMAIGSGNELIAYLQGALVAHRYLQNPSRKSIRGMLRIWVMSNDYLARLAAPGSLRYYPDLRVAGPVSEEHRAKAREQLKERLSLGDAEVDAMVQAADEKYRRNH